MNTRTEQALTRGLINYLAENPFLAGTVREVVSGRTLADRTRALTYLLFTIGQIPAEEI
jgi:hypothetical protein